MKIWEKWSLKLQYLTIIRLKSQIYEKYLGSFLECFYSQYSSSAKNVTMETDFSKILDILKY